MTSFRRNWVILLAVLAILTLLGCYDSATQDHRKWEYQAQRECASKGGLWSQWETTCFAVDSIIHISPEEFFK